ncbi:carbohydrate-binding module family 50 protein [Dothidotthia symphoricarpi CBS 119687]|uniref:Carbohydrate-binding module family 50 protein n=1 Tax=Dothidotthia symphoricarpi CBS 119687 TaxID=1392245 RepID=A0A6A6AGV9_9PLEO|nr:carbohydrate-binding module family 50 protein [Dothidotthia symphoricarpi CBS 119687]KAF2130127.1 carbohydrate-binding module family 50 protein [Dothidotthia symphoricarpi CBS 119687]
MKLIFSIVLLLGSTGLQSLAQQIPGSLLSFDLLQLSVGCLTAVNKTVSSCPRWLPQHTGEGDASFDLLNDKRLSQLCGTACAQDLETSRAAIQKACTSATDVMVPVEGVAYPATFLADRYLYALQLGCLESSSGQYCDSIVSTWLNQSSSANWTVAQNCSDCELGVQKLQLSSPFGYDVDGAANFASLTSSCKVEGYTYATPAAYAINATTVPDPPSRTCTNTYTVQDGDTCISISLSKNVSTYSLIVANGIDISCNLLAPAGSTVCLPNTCNTYQLDMYDRCDDITAGARINQQQLLSWNPMINNFCNNLGSWFGWNLCIRCENLFIHLVFCQQQHLDSDHYSSSPDGAVNPGQGNSVATDAPVPTNAQDLSNRHCGQWYATKTDDLCDTISLAFGITVDDFYFLNPQVDHNCSNLWLETSYCVRPVGNIATYYGYPTSTPGTIFPKPTPEPTSTPPPVVTPPLSAKAAGTVDGCLHYMNAFDESLSSVFDLNVANSCEVWAAQADVTVEDLLAWNPSLSKANCVLQSGKSYCILNLTPTPTTSQPPTNTGGTPPPAETQPGAISSCKKWYVVVSGDGCWGIANAAGISLEDFYKWNPGVGECSALWPDYAVCIGI